jgi:putative nucleotidyltransferase with HDIG domain
MNQSAMALLSGVLAAALASILLPAFEYLFKIVTDIRLLELSNLNAPTLKKLSVEAPGTYHHSLMVATLAEAAAESIEANPLLVRVAAYYHDVGKALNPEYFVENQNYGGNMHEDITPSGSYHIIASHVKDGLQLAKKIGLPQQISDMIPQHHGTRIMTFFFHKAQDSSKGINAKIIEADFRYPGPKPQTKEAAIVMMADSVEAASRTLTEPTPGQIQGMICHLVDDIVSDNQLNECDITLKDVQLVKESFCKILTGTFHHRIDYPGYDFKGAGSDSEKNAVQDTDRK